MGNKNRYKSKFDCSTCSLLRRVSVRHWCCCCWDWSCSLCSRRTIMSVYVRENISFSILISDDMKEADILKLQKKLNQEPFVKQSEYISKKQALKEQTEAMGTDPEEFLGYNPFTAST